jgi:hypothetical protein
MFAVPGTFFASSFFAFDKLFAKDNFSLENSLTENSSLGKIFAGNDFVRVFFAYTEKLN